MLSLFQQVLSEGSIGGCHAWESDSDVRRDSTSLKKLVHNAELYSYLMKNKEYFLEKGYLTRILLYEEKNQPIYKYSPTEKAIIEFEYKFRTKAI